VFLLGGASGVGKTSLSYPLAHRLGVAITEVDDFQVVLECLTTPEQQPALHFWRTHPAPHTLAPEEIVAQGIAIGEALTPALAAVIVNHVESRACVVLEGDFILPSLVAHPAVAPLYEAGQVRAAIVHEPVREQLVVNYLRREPEAGEQHLRAQVSWQYGRWLEQEARRCGVPVLPARPWETALDGLLALCV
jgi:2-phosphoglycerate kinase